VSGKVGPPPAIGLRLGMPGSLTGQSEVLTSRKIRG